MAGGIFAVRLRSLMFVMIAAVVLLGPAYHQVFERHTRWLRPWMMFRDTAIELLDVEFRVRAANGTEQVIDRFETLGHPNPRTAPKWVRRVVKIRKLSRELCQALGPGTDLRIYAQRATVDGWKPRFAGEKNLCAANRKKGRKRP